MTPSLPHLLLYMLIPAGVVVAGSAAALFGGPSGNVRSALHHAAAGALFAAAAGELVVELVAKQRVAPLVVGFVVGAVVMLGVRVIGDRVEAKATVGVGKVAGLLAALAVDVFVDGVVVAIGFAIGQASGVVFVVAFSLEMAFLGLTTAVELRSAGASRRAVLAGPALLGALLLSGSVAGHFLSRVSGFGFDAIVAFATAVLVYLVAEELLVEAHEEKDAPLLTAFFFVAFLGVLTLDIALS